MSFWNLLGTYRELQVEKYGKRIYNLIFFTSNHLMKESRTKFENDTNNLEMIIIFLKGKLEKENGIVFKRY